MTTLKDFIESRRWEYPSNYSGEDFSNYICGLGRSRDSDVLENSNFESLLDKLGGESETILVSRAGHWAVGWVEEILVHESDLESLNKLKDILETFSDYPVIDDSHYRESQYDYYSEYADSAKSDLAEAIQTHFDLPESVLEDSELLQLAYELNMQAQFHGGEHACVDVYQFREPGLEDIRRFVDCLHRCEHQDENPWYEYLLVACGLETED